VTIKDTLQSFESEIVILVAIAVGVLIAVKVISAFIAGAKYRAANAAAQTAAVVASPGNAGLAAASSGNSGLNATGVTAVINNYLVSVPHFAMTDIDEKSAALVLAIVAHDSGIPLEELQVKSIKAIDG